MMVKKLDENLVQIFVKLTEAKESQYSQLARNLILRGDIQGYLNLEIQPDQYTDPIQLKADYQVRSFLRKYPGLPLEADLESAAEEAFFAIERENVISNHRLSPFAGTGLYDPTDGPLLHFIDGVRKKVKRLMGPLPKDLKYGRFGKGATFDDRGPHSGLPHKMSSVPTITSDASCLLPFFWETAWGRAVMSRRSSPRSISGNRFSVVPKDATKSRGICVEPSINVFFQLHVGEHLKQRLKNVFGIDLYNAQPKHQAKAKAASISGRFGTIDLSDASDRMCLNLVKSLLPSEWFDLLNTLRSKQTYIRNRWHWNAKFSSMGNGFTFELMTIILYAICWEATSRHHFIDVEHQDTIMVFGDDIIAPVAVCEDLLKILPWMGFKVNEAKTFIHGGFRESCGGDFFKGIDVRPYFLKEEVNEPPQWMALANGIRRVGRSHYQGDRDPGLYFRAWRRTLDCLPKYLRELRGPEQLGDIVIHDHVSTWIQVPGARRPKFYRRTPDGRSFVRALLPQGKSRGLGHFRADVQLACALYGVPSSGYTIRGEIRGYKRKWVPIGY